MKLLRVSLMVCAWMVGICSAFAQISKTVDRGSTLDLSAEPGAKNYQWQVSSDGQNYINLPNAKQQNLSIKINAPGFYRVEKTSQSNEKSYGEVVDVTLTTINYSNIVSVTSGAHGYVEDKAGNPSDGIEIPEDRNGKVSVATKSLTEWTSGDVLAVCYINHPADVVDTKMDINVNAGKKVSFRLNVYAPTDLTTPLATTYTTVVGNGLTQNVFLVGLQLPRKDYYRYALECLSGWENIKAIEKLYHYSPSEIKSYKNGFLSSPSVHLRNWKSTDPAAPKGSVYDWCYQEVMIPEESDIPGTYVMSLGVLRGYMGIQMNGYMPDGKTRHDVIFSMWDDGDTDANPDLPANLRSSLVDISPIAYSERFGSEGTGVKSFVSGHHWECGKFVQFITNCRTEMATYTVVENGREVTKQQENTLVSAWFNAQDGKGWQYISTLRLANKHTRFDSWYSFLENYNYQSGQLLRKGFYRNGYACTTDGGSPKWYHFNKVNFYNTDGGPEDGKRNDYGHGATSLHQGENGEGAFFMTTGGFLKTNVTSNEVKLNTNNIAVDTINLNALLDRVNLAVAHEQYNKMNNDYLNSFVMDKKNWSVVDFSSEEISGEGSNGRAAQIIDGNVDTYWHSKWQSGGSKCPHQITVDMAEEKLVDSLEITMSGGEKRYMKAFNVYVSSDDVQNADRSWTKVYSTNDAPNQVKFRVALNKPAKGRFLKIEITSSRANDGDHCRINEIEVYGTSVGVPVLNKKGWEVIGFSSEETSGEGANGHAAQIIDGNVNSYWHSKWSGNGSKCPHQITVDMKGVDWVEGMQITMSDGPRRFIKAFNLYTSVDNLTWNKVYETNDAPQQDTFEFLLNEPVLARYFKIEITASRATDGDHTRINEVEVLGRFSTPAQSMMAEAELLLADPNAHKVGYTADVHYYALQDAYDRLAVSSNSIDAGTKMIMALNIYKSTNDINLPKSNVIYTLTSVGRGCLMADEQNNKFQSNMHSSINVAADYKDVKQQFTFVDKDGKLYLYNCYLKKYMTNETNTLSEEPRDPIILVKHPGYEGNVFMKFDNSHNVNFGGSKELTIDGWGNPDAGNAFKVEEVGLVADMKNAQGALRENNIATFSAPYAVVPETGVVVYYSTYDADKSAILLQAIAEGEAIPENAGVLVASDNLMSARFIKADDQAVVAELPGNVLLNSAQQSVVMQSGDYILTKPANQPLAFYQAQPGSTLAQYRSYLHLNSAAASIRMIIVGGDQTGIDDAVIEDGIKAPVYDLSGRVVNRIVKGGIYIQDGKKFIAK